MAKVRLQATGLDKRLKSRGGGVQALDGLVLEGADSEFVSVIGSSGCGKSTLLNFLALEAPSAGTLWLDGEPCQPDRLLGRVGYIPQRDLLLPWRSICTTPSSAWRWPESGGPRPGGGPWSRRLGLTGLEHHRPDKLSGGMRQRAALLYRPGRPRGHPARRAVRRP